jgi:hypothetical protein
MFVAAVGCAALDSSEQLRETVRAAPLALGSADSEDSTLGKVFSAPIEDGVRGDFTVEDIPSTAYVPLADREAKPSEPIPESPGKISERLQRELDEVLAGRAGERRVEVVVTFLDDIRIPRFPEPRDDLSRDADENRVVAAETERLAASIEASRASSYDEKAAEFARNFDAKEIGRFWLINGMTLELPIGAVAELSKRADIQHVELRLGDAGRPVNNVLDGRVMVQSDPYFSSSAFVGLLDSGVRSTHTLLASRLGVTRDCVNGTSNSCQTGAGLNPNDDCNHGTSAAAIMSGNSNSGNATRGVTGVTLDSFKTGPGCAVDIAATVRGFQAAVVVSDRVIVDEDQESGTETSAIATAADNAFNAGAVVISAAGNFGPGWSTVRTPGNAHKVLAIGAVDVTSGALQGFSGRGPTGDGRIKPDLLAPTNVTTASNASNTATWLFGGTSAATPFGGGTALLIRNFLRGTSWEIAPGLVNAFMIMSGDLRNFDNNNGAGVIRLPSNGNAWWGSVSVTNGQEVNVPINLGTPTAAIDAAIWWPESTSTHNDIDLRLIRPDTTWADSSTNINSVFEKVRTTTNLQTGTWNLRVRGYSVTGTQTVYYALHRR